MGEQKLTAIMGAEFIMETVMGEQRLQPVRPAPGPATTRRVHPQTCRTSSTSPLHCTASHLSTHTMVVVTVLADNLGVDEAKLDNNFVLVHET